MLRNLQISNYALIEKLDISFENGFSVITGETGAGKSIIMGALGLLMGQRADAKAIKAGEKKCFVEGIFAVEGLGLQPFFEENGIDYDEQECIIRREVATTGKSRAFINDTPVQAALLKEVGTALIDIHSQHQNLLLRHENFLLEVLDAVAANATLRDRYQKCFKEWVTERKALAALEKELAAEQENLEFLKFQITQLETANLKEGEQEELEQEGDALEHAEEIKENLYTAQAKLSDETTANALTLLRQAVQALQGISEVFKPAAQLAERAECARIELKDISEELERDLENTEFDPARLEAVNERLSLIYELEKKFHAESITQLLAAKDHIAEKLSLVENADETLQEKAHRVQEIEKDLGERGRTLTRSREKAAEDTANALKETLAFLGMPDTRLHFAFSSRTVPDTNGMDNVTFMFSANKNVPEQDVSQIASGGETARLMLALKAFISGKRNLPTVVFDEIDTGVSGTAAEKMAKVMRRMADNCQVICITHLPQIAALGKQHYHVFKTDGPTSTTSHITKLSAEERVREVANMLSGAEMTEAAINNAKSLLGMKSE